MWILLRLRWLVRDMWIKHFLGRIALDWFLFLFVCLARLCTCLNGSAHLDSIWRVHLWGPLTHCVKWGSLNPERKGRFGVEPLVKTCSCKLLLTSVEWNEKQFHFSKLLYGACYCMHQISNLSCSDALIVNCDHMFHYSRRWWQASCVHVVF